MFNMTSTRVWNHLLDKALRTYFWIGFLEIYSFWIHMWRMRTDPVFIMKQIKIGCKPSRIYKKIDQVLSTLNFLLQEIITNWIDEL